jgi:hypothetical protein
VLTLFSKEIVMGAIRLTADLNDTCRQLYENYSIMACCNSLPWPVDGHLIGIHEEALDLSNAAPEWQAGSSGC